MSFYEENGYKFKSPSEISHDIFTYLGKVKDDDKAATAEYDDDDSGMIYDVDKPRVPGNKRTGTLTTRVNHVSSDKPAYKPSTDIGTTAVMPKAFYRKKANGDGSFSIGGIKLKDIADFRRKIFANNMPLESLVYGGLAGLGTYWLAPHIVRWSGQKPLGVSRKTGDLVWVTNEDRNLSSLAVGLGIAGLNLVKHVNYDNPSWGQLWSMPKRASMLGPTDYVPTNFAMNAVALNPDIPDNLKYNTLNALGTINSPMISSTDMVTAGIKSGMSGYSGFPVGRIAAAATADALTAYGIGSALGVHDPSRLAKTTGVISLLGRSIANSFDTNKEFSL